MATRKTVDKIQIKRGSGNTLSDTQNTTVLDVGEPFYHVNTGRVYIGNGENRISELPYMSAKNGVALGSNGTFVGDSGVTIGENTVVSDYGYSIGKDSYVEHGGISIGGNTRSFNHGISIGENASVDAISSDAISIGHGALSEGSKGISIGANTVSYEGGVAIGANASQTSASICIGENSNSVRINSIVIGSGSKITNKEQDHTDNAIAIGTGAEAMSGSSIAIGRTCVAGGNGSSQTGDACIAIGEDSEASGDRSLAVGTGAIAGGDSGISIGKDSHSTAPRSIAFGTCSVASNVGSISIGSYSHAGGYAVDIGGSAKLVGDNFSTRDITGEESVSILGFSGGDFGVSIGEGSSAGKLGVSIGYNAKTIIPYGDNISRVAIGKEAVASNDNDARIQFFNHSTGGFENHAFIGSSAILLSGSSDRRLKQNIESANTEMCLSDVCSIPLYKYEYKPFVKETEDKHLVGWMADDVEKVFKHAVFEGDRTFTECDENGNDIIDSETGEPKQFTIEKVKSINMQRVGLPTLWGAVQELNKLMTATQERVTELETSVKTLKKENTLLKKKLKELDTSTKEEPSIEE